MTRITMRIMMRMKKSTIVLPPVTRNMMRMKTTMRIMMKTRMRTKRIIVALIPAMKRKKTKIMITADAVQVAAAGHPTAARDAPPAEVHLAAAAMTDVVLRPWIAIASARSAAKADAPIMKKEAPTVMTNAEADQAAAVAPVAADVPAAATGAAPPPGAVQAAAHPVAAAAAHPAEAVTRDNPVIQADNSPAAADAQAMEAVRATAADVQVAAAAAPAEGNTAHDFFHTYKQIGPTNALFVCFLNNYLNLAYHGTIFYRPPQQRDEIKEYEPKKTSQHRQPDRRQRQIIR